MTTVRDDIVRRMWLEEGASVTAIKTALNFAGVKATRNSVLGLIHRRGWKRDRAIGIENNRKAHSKGRPPRPKRVFSKSLPREEWHLPLIKEEDEVIVDVVAPSSLNVPLHQLSSFQCHWIEHDVEPAYDTPCCGAPHANVAAWLCDAHMKLAYRRVPKRRDIKPEYK